MLSGYMQTSGLNGLGCGLDTSCGCDRGMGSLLDPSTWGPSDYLVVGTLAVVAWKLFRGGQRRAYTRRVVRRLRDAS